MLGLGVDFSLGIKGVEHEAGSRGGVDVLEMFQMIRVAADWLRPARLEGTPRRVVEHVARGSPAAPHLPDGLLGEDGIDCRADRLQRSHVAWCRQPEPVTKASRGMQSEAGRVRQGDADRSARALSGMVSATKRTLPSMLSAVPAKPRNADSSSATAPRRFTPSTDRSSQ